MEFPYLTEASIDAEAAALVQAVFGGPWQQLKPIDLESIIYEHLSPKESLSFNDEADLPLVEGELVLGKTLPIRGKILLNRALKADLEAGRARFTLAHELGHWMLHRKLFLANRDALDLFATMQVQEEDFEFVGLSRAVFPKSCRAGAVAREEWQANRFAVALLINAEVLRNEFLSRFDVPVVARSSREWNVPRRNLRDLASELGRVSVRGHPALRDVFGLSVEAMAIALESRGYVVESAPIL